MSILNKVRLSLFLGVTLQVLIIIAFVMLCMGKFEVDSFNTELLMFVNFSLISGIILDIFKKYGKLLCGKCQNEKEIEERREEYETVKAYLKTHECSIETFEQYLERENDKSIISFAKIGDYDFCIEVKFDDMNCCIEFLNLYCPELNINYVYEELVFEAIQWNIVGQTPCKHTGEVSCNECTVCCDFNNEVEIIES